LLFANMSNTNTLQQSSKVATRHHTVTSEALLKRAEQHIPVIFVASGGMAFIGGSTIIAAEGLRHV